jgi:flagellin
MVVQHNMTASNTNRQLGITTGALAKSTEKLSSGYKINRAGDDAAGLSISEKMRSQIRGLDQASNNAEDGISLIQTAEGALSEIHSMLQRMNELSVKAANDTNQSIDRSAIQDEIDALSSEVTRIASSTQFNKMNLFTSSKTLSLQIGANNGQSIALALSKVTASSLDVNALSMSTHAAANSAITKVQAAINSVSQQRSALGALQNRLEYTISNLDSSSENTQAAESRIRDVDMASEMVKYSKNNILMQAGQSMLAQANSQTQGVLSLLQ